jgi:anaerobic nitric oxide reductase transcription regulator
MRTTTSLPSSVAESELFGHEAGAFTDARKQRLGKFQVADGASLFLDEIGELPLAIQAKLLRVLQSGEVQRVGSDQNIHVDVRLFAATNRDLHAEVKAGRFRADLLHRLDVCRLLVPALRDHAEDIPVLAGHFCDGIRRRLGLGPVRVAERALEALALYSWPGNVRELQNVLSRAALHASARVERGDPVLLELADLGSDFQSLSAIRPAPNLDSEPAPSAPALPPGPLRPAVEAFERRMIQAALERNGGVWARAAKELGLHRSNLHHLAQRLGLRD